MDKPLPDRIRPLEGAGMKILYSNMGATPKREWTWAGPVSAVVIVAAVLYFGWAWLP